MKAMNSKTVQWGGLLKTALLCCLWLVGPSAGRAQTVSPISNGQTISSLSGSQGAWRHYYIDVPSGVSPLEVKIWGGTGDADLYVRRGSQPTEQQYDHRPYLSGNNETVTITSPGRGPLLHRDPRVPGVLRGVA